MSADPDRERLCHDPRFIGFCLTERPILTVADPARMLVFTRMSADPRIPSDPYFYHI
jgi:hypothetical protein